MKLVCGFLALVLICSVLPADDFATGERPLPPPEPFFRDSGKLPNTALEPRVLHV